MDIQTQPTQEGFYWLNDSRRYGWEIEFDPLCGAV